MLENPPPLLSLYLSQQCKKSSICDINNNKSQLLNFYVEIPPIMINMRLKIKLNPKEEK